MRIDADCHLSADPARYGIGADELIRRLDEVGVDKAITWPMVSYTREIAPDNKAIYEAVQKYPDRIINFGGVNPMLGMDKARDELRRCIEQYGVRGVKLNGARDGYDIDDPDRSLPLVEMINDAGIALAFHCGANDYERTHPFRIAQVSEAYPDLNIMIVHMGGGASPDISEAVMEFAAMYPQWYLIDSEADYRKVLAGLQALGPDRICYGSDTPFCPMRYEWGIRQTVYQDLSEQDRDKVLGGNIARMLGL